VVGVAFFVAVAIGRGWINEPTQIVLAAAGSVALLGVGVWLRERRGAKQASLAAVGAAVASLYLTLVAATQLYALIPVPLALALALAVGVLASALAVRWEAPAIAALGIVGALLAPPLVGAEASAGSATFLIVALGAAVGVLVWRRWEWLAVAAFLVSAPQVLGYAFSGDSVVPVYGALGVSAAYWALMVAAAVGYEVRRPATSLRASSGILLIGAALVCAGAGAGALENAGRDSLAEWWVAGLAGAHGVVGLSVLRSRRANRAVGLLLLVVGVSLGEVALGLLLEGPVLALGWATTAVAFAALARGRASAKSVDELLAGLGCGAQLIFATFHVLLFEAKPDALGVAGAHPPDGLVAVAGVAVAAATCAQLVPAKHASGRAMLYALAMAALAYLTGLSLGGAALVAVLCAEAAALAAVAKASREGVVLAGAGTFLTLAAGHALALEAPPEALRYGVASLPEAALALGAVALVLWRAARLDVDETWRPARLDVAWTRRARWALEAAAVATLVYLASVAIVTPFQRGGETLGLELEVRQQGQLLLSAFWGLTGLAGLVAGLASGARGLRLGGLALLTLAIGKVFLYDLAALDSLYRVLSFVALGLLSLAGAAAYGRMRPARDEVTPTVDARVEE
jgi:uncharacterized membrane protein